MKRVSPTEANALLGEGYLYVDVRSVPEFEAEHPAGAFNVPLMNMGPGGMTPNGDFAKVMAAKFAKDAKIVVGCKSGGRSLRAAQVLSQQGFTAIVDQRAGFDGARDHSAVYPKPGWKAAGLDVEAGDGGDRAYSKLAASK